MNITNGQLSVALEILELSLTIKDYNGISNQNLNENYFHLVNKISEFTLIYRLDSHFLIGTTNLISSHLLTPPCPPEPSRASSSMQISSLGRASCPPAWCGVAGALCVLVPKLVVFCNNNNEKEFNQQQCYEEPQLRRVLHSTFYYWGGSNHKFTDYIITPPTAACFDSLCIPQKAQLRSTFLSLPTQTWNSQHTPLSDRPRQWEFVEGILRSNCTTFTQIDQPSLTKIGLCISFCTLITQIAEDLPNNSRCFEIYRILHNRRRMKRTRDSLRMSLSQQPLYSKYVTQIYIFQNAPLPTHLIWSTTWYTQRNCAIFPVTPHTLKFSFSHSLSLFRSPTHLWK